MPYDADEAAAEVAKVEDWVEQTEEKVGDRDIKGCDGISGSKGLPTEPKSQMTSTEEPPKAPAKVQEMLPPSSIPKKRRKPEATIAEVSTSSVELLAEEAQT